MAISYAVLDSARLVLLNQTMHDRLVDSGTSLVNQLATTARSLPARVALYTPPF
jgi:hypothetical protein